MKKLFVWLVFGVVGVASLWPAQVSAHVLKTDGQIGAVMHVDPDDDPIAGQRSNFYFEIKDKTSKFTEAGCNCSFAVSENGKQIDNQPLTGVQASYTFPDLGVYEVSINGKPKTTGEFQDFKLVYDVRVDRSVAGSAAVAAEKPKSNSALYVAGGAAVLVLFGALLALSLKKPAKPKPAA